MNCRHSSFTLYAIYVQIEYHNIEQMDTVDKIITRYGAGWKVYHRMYGADRSGGTVESWCRVARIHVPYSKRNILKSCVVNKQHR